MLKTTKMNYSCRKYTNVYEILKFSLVQIQIFIFFIKTLIDATKKWRRLATWHVSMTSISFQRFHFQCRLTHSSSVKLLQYILQTYTKKPWISLKHDTISSNKEQHYLPNINLHIKDAKNIATFSIRLLWVTNCLSFCYYTQSV